MTLLESAPPGRSLPPDVPGSREAGAPMPPVIVAPVDDNPNNTIFGNVRVEFLFRFIPGIVVDPVAT